MGITIVIPTLNRGQFLIDSVNDLLAQEYRPLEILIVDQSDTIDPKLQEIVKANPELISYYHVDFRGLPIARNFGWQHARYDMICYIDDDIRCEPGFARAHVEALQLPEVGVVAGGIDEPSRPEKSGVPVGRFNFWTSTPTRGFSSQQDQTVDIAPGGNFSVWRHVFEKVGGIDEGLGFGAALYEETEFCLRARAAGFRIQFAAKARLIHLAAPNGGCRTPDIDRYMRSLSHNRRFLIDRFLKWYHRPTAWGRLLLLNLSYARASRRLGVLRSGFNGFLQAGPRARKGPEWTQWSQDRDKASASRKPPSPR